MTNETAAIFARHIEIQLRSGRFEQAHNVINEVEIEQRSQSVLGLATSLNDTSLPLRVVNLMGHHGIFTVGELVTAPASRLAALPGIGPGTLSRLRGLAACSKLGLSPVDRRKLQAPAPADDWTHSLSC